MNRFCTKLFLYSVSYRTFLNVCAFPWITVVTSFASFPVWGKYICEDDEERQHNERYSILITLSLF